MVTRTIFGFRKERIDNKEGEKHNVTRAFQPFPVMFHAFF
jgi:hypothetical protein